jgi:hypothetical protein
MGTLPSKIILPLTHPVPGLFDLLYWMHKGWVKLVDAMDRLIDTRERFALNYICTCKRE